nr:MAG TPA: Flagellar hook-length control protein FliK [Caudoviricetes sp.]
MIITSEILSDAIKKALQQTIEDLKAQLAELGVEVE